VGQPVVEPLDFYDLFGPTKRSRKGFAAQGGYEHYLIYDDPRTLQFVAEGAFFDRIDTLPQRRISRADSTG